MFQHQSSLMEQAGECCFLLKTVLPCICWPEEQASLVPVDVAAIGQCTLAVEGVWGPSYLPSPGHDPCSGMPAAWGTTPPPALHSALELWGGGSGPAAAKEGPSVGGSGGWKAGHMCFLVRVPPRRWAWKSISFTPKLHGEKRVNTAL